METNVSLQKTCPVRIEVWKFGFKHYIIFFLPIIHVYDILYYSQDNICDFSQLLTEMCAC